MMYHCKYKDTAFSADIEGSDIEFAAREFAIQFAMAHRIVECVAIFEITSPGGLTVDYEFELKVNYDIKMKKL